MEGWVLVAIANKRVCECHSKKEKKWITQNGLPSFTVQKSTICSGIRWRCVLRVCEQKRLYFVLCFEANVEISIRHCQYISRQLIAKSMYSLRS